MIPFYQRISRTNFKICFSRSCSPSWVTKQTYFLEILLVCRHTLVAQNGGASVRLHHNLTTPVFFIHHFLLVFATQLIETNFFHFGTCFIIITEFCIWKPSLFNNLVVAAWNQTIYSQRLHMKSSSVYCFNFYIYIYIYIYSYYSLNKSKVKLEKTFTPR